MRSCLLRPPEDRSMSSPRAHEVLYESEAALRLVDQELSGMHDARDAAPPPTPTISLSDLPNILEQANAQILNVLARLRESRAALQTTALERLQTTHEKIREVTSATEDAAINIMDACDRATQMVDELDTIDQAETPDRDKATGIRANLRDELFLMMGALQFQDITSQQLAHASSVLVDMEQRLLDVARLFDHNVDTGRISLRKDAVDEATFDPNATTRNAEGRQALADEIFTAVKAPAA
jgi:chemotaxis regulatin CheY-phosphate phosphatase CheZ